MNLDFQKVVFQLVYGRCNDRAYPLVDLTYWTAHDVLDQDRLVTKSLSVCSIPDCYGVVANGICQSCFAQYPGEEGREPWEGILLSGPKIFVATKIAELWEKLRYPADITSIYLPIRVSSPRDFLTIARGAEVDDLMEKGNYRVYKADTILKDLATGVPLTALLEMFLEL